jgi:riboflavin kinase/FMN adenylyltransferase
VARLIYGCAVVEVFDGYRALFRPLLRPAIALGNFDGVHRGHQALFAHAVAAAARRDGDAAVYTFEPHPALVLAPELAPPLITSRERKLELIAAAGIDVCVLEPFTRELAAMAPERFAHDILFDTLGAAELIVGYDFTYGRKRSGTVEELRDAGAARGVEVRVIAPVTIDGIVASSTKVRDFALQGKLDGVRLLLGRDLDVDGEVVKGAGRGRSIGVPTANLRVAPEQLLPLRGVYAVRGRILDADRGFEGVANLGTNPTFVDTSALSLEVHVFDLDQDLYGRRLRVEFAARLRGERRFTGIDELVAQIRADIGRARQLLAAR